MTGNETKAGAVAGVGPQTLRDWMAAGEALLIDVRETHEFEFEYIPGSLFVPLSIFDPARFPPLRDRRLVIVCAVGKRSAAVCDQLRRAGFSDIVNLEGGLKAWTEAGFKTLGMRFDDEDYTI